MKEPKKMTDDELKQEIEKTKSVTEKIFEQELYHWELIKEEGRRLREEFSHV